MPLESSMAVAATPDPPPTYWKSFLRKLKLPSITKLYSEARYRIVLATFLATFTAYAERTGFSISYTLLAKEAGVDEALKGTIMSAFYWGYGLSQVPGGMASQRFGGRIMLFLCFITWSLASCLTPSSARYTGPLIVARVIVGVAQGFLIPAVHTVLSQWIPPHERARCVSLTTSGMYLGSAGAMYVMPALATAWGPASLFKFNGCLGFAWALFWLLQSRSGPRAQQGYIPVTAKEMDGKKGLNGSAVGGPNKPIATPWRTLLTSTAVWAIVVNNFTFHYAFFVIMNWLPTYFQSLIGTDLATLGGARTLPYLVMFLSSNMGGWAGDYLILQRHFTVAQARKAVNTLGFAAACVFMVIMASARSVSAGLLSTTAVLGFLGFARGGFSVNHMDIAPRYAGVVMGVSNTAGTLSGVIGVAVTGWLLERSGGSTSAVGWATAFGVCIVNCAVGIFAFLLGAQGTRIVS